LERGGGREANEMVIELLDPVCFCWVWKHWALVANFTKHPAYQGIMDEFKNGTVTITSPVTVGNGTDNGGDGSDDSCDNGDADGDDE
jgi:hypothetical protein